jgi:hypothetical protein
MSAETSLLALPFTDFQIDAIMVAAEPLDPDQRAAFLELVAANLWGRELGSDGIIARVCAEAQARFFTPRRTLMSAPRPGRASARVNCRPARSSSASRLTPAPSSLRVTEVLLSLGGPAGHCNIDQERFARRVYVVGF